MKKLLAIALVLGLASMANAALTITADGAATGVEPMLVAPGTVVTIGIKTDANIFANLTYLDFYGGELGVAEILAPFNSGSLDGFGLTNYGDFMEYDISTDVSPDTNPVGAMGVFFQVPVTIYGPVTVELYDGQVALQDVFSMDVPEPMTMSLLALGGLGLLRRR